KPGQKAPDFKLVDKDKNEVTLNNFKGKPVVLFFFPMAWTGACTKEMCGIQEDYNQYEESGAQVVGISADSHFALKHFAEDNKINFPLLSDYNREAIKAYDVLLPEFAFGYKNTAQRATFVIDKDGIIRYSHVTAS